MTDNVIITGVADGAFEGALSGLPAWATENTANKIADILQKTYNLQAKTLIGLAKQANTGGLSSEDAKKANDELDKLTKNFKEENKQHDKDKDFYNKTNNQRLKDEKNWKDSNAGFLRSAAIGALLEKSAIAIDDVFKNSFETYTNLNAAGIDLITGFDKTNNGFESLAQLSSLTGVRFTELQATMQKYNTAVNAFTAFKFAKTVGIATKGLAEFGYSSKESAELLGAYLESQRGFTDNRNRSEADVAKDLVGFGKRINDVSMATGMQRTAILANLDALAHSVKATILTGQVGDQASEKLLEFAASFKDQRLGNEFLAMMTDAIKPLNETFQHLQRAGDGAFGQMEMQFINRLKASGASPEEMQKQTAEWVSANKAGIQQMIQRNNLLAQAGNADAAAANEHLNLLLQQERTYHALSDSDRARIAATNKSRAEFSDAWEKFLSSFQRIFSIFLPALNMLATGLTWLADGIDLVAKTIDGIGNAIGIPKLTSVFGMLAAGGLALAGVIKLLGGSLTGLFKGILGGGKGGAGSALGGAGGKGGGLLSGLGKGIGDIGKGLGKGIGSLIEGFLEGLSKGLKAMSDPKIFIGIAALAATGAALWITGKAVQQFVGISWEDLAKAGVSIAALMLGLSLLDAIAPEILFASVALLAAGAAIWVLGAALKGFPKDVMPDMSGAFSKLGDVVGNIFGGILDIVSSVFDTIKDIVISVVGGIKSAFDTIWSVISWPFKEIGKLISGVFGAADAVLSWYVNGVKSAFSTIWSVISWPFKEIGKLISGVFGAADAVLSWYVNGVKSAFSTIWNIISGTVDGIKSAFGTVWEIISWPFKEFGKLIGVVFDGVKVVLSSISDVISNMISPIKWIIDKASGLFSGSGANGAPESASKQLDKLSESANGLEPYANTLATINDQLTIMSSLLSSFTGIDTLKSIVDTINGIDISKALVLGTLSKIGVIATPSTPVPSTLDSPSTVSTNTPAVSSAASDVSPAAPSGKTTTSQNDLSAALEYQSNLTQQLLEKLGDLVSVNKDILKYSKANS